MTSKPGTTATNDAVQRDAQLALRGELYIHCVDVASKRIIYLSAALARLLPQSQLPLRVHFSKSPLIFVCGANLKVDIGQRKKKKKETKLNQSNQEENSACVSARFMIDSLELELWNFSSVVGHGVQIFIRT